MAEQKRSKQKIAAATRAKRIFARGGTVPAPLKRFTGSSCEGKENQESRSKRCLSLQWDRCEIAQNRIELIVLAPSKS